MFHIYKRDDNGNETELKFIKTESTKQDAIKICRELNTEYLGTAYAPYCYFEKWSYQIIFNRF